MDSENLFENIIIQLLEVVNESSPNLSAITEEIDTSIRSLIVEKLLDATLEVNLDSVIENITTKDPNLFSDLENVIVLLSEKSREEETLEILIQEKHSDIEIVETSTIENAVSLILKSSEISEDEESTSTLSSEQSQDEDASTTASSEQSQDEVSVPQHLLNNLKMMRWVLHYPQIMNLKTNPRLLLYRFNS